jgi:FtsP/CotA-like multicopper oxidase with cupredoxin domain
VFEQQPWQDGVAMVTQCPVLPGSHFLYRFVVQNKAGTYWYHSHVGAQVGDGAFGAFIVRPKVLVLSFEIIMLTQIIQKGFFRQKSHDADKFVAISAWWWRDQHSLYQEWASYSKGLKPEDHDHLFFENMKSVLVNGSPNKTEVTVEHGKSIRLRLLNSCRFAFFSGFFFEKNLFLEIVPRLLL